MKRRLSILAVIFLLICFLFGGLFAARKLFSMYRNVWDTLDAIAATSKSNSTKLNDLTKDVEALNAQLKPLSTHVDHLHCQTYYSADAEKNAYDYSWVNPSAPYIAHACGGIDGATYTNSREAFILNYELGQRVFEIDFNLSEDGVLIAAHDENHWRSLTGSDQPYTLENFNQLPLLGRYEPLTGSEVVELLAAYPDAYVVTDSKSTTKEEVMLAFSQLVHCAKQTHPEVLERIIPQIYHEEMLPWISSVYPFRSVIFTLYQIHWTPEAILDFCMNSGVRFITMPLDQVNEDVLRLWDTLGIHVAVHTVNDKESVPALFDMGVDMIYTDFITPN